MFRDYFRKYVVCGLVVLFMATGTDLFASGIQVLNTSVTTNASKTSAQVKFTLIWDHSWRVATGPTNWDAAWVFIKYRTLPGDNWRHVYLRNDSTKMPSNASYNLGNSIAVVGGVNTTVAVGAFIYRNAAGNGTIQFTDCELQWDFVQNGLTGGEQVEVCVLATEMVYVPQGAFWLGDYTSTGRFRRNASNPINGAGARAEEVVNVSAQNVAYLNYFSNTWYNSASYTLTPNNLYNNTLSSVAAPSPDDITGGNYAIRSSTHINNTTAFTAYSSVINANYPRGFSAIYCMKYEITQGEYVQFLNKNLVTVKNGLFYVSDTVPPTTPARNSIRRKTGTGTSNTPAEFELILPSAAYLPCNYLGTKDVMAWLIWAGLRPMSELEFEKICRGPEAIPGTATLRPQYAFGSIDIANAAGFSAKGSANESPSNLTGNCAVATAAGVATIGGGTNSVLDGPMRSGGFSTPVSSRVKAGATYYGVMEMSGNLWERCVSVGNDAGRAFQGMIVAGHGNGEIGPAVNPDLPIGGGWPPVAAVGLGFRGGSYLDQHERARISDRYFINVNDHSRRACFGGRGVRTAL